MKAAARIGRFIVWGALIDVLVLCFSFVFFGGAHGPAGPMLVLWVLNAPVVGVVLKRFPTYETPMAVDLALAFGSVVLNGALYGAVAGLAVAFWRRARGPKPAP